MTAISGFIRAQKRPGELGVHSLDHATIAVPDLSVAEHFYSEFGLDLKAKGDAIDLHTVGHPHRWARVVEGSRKKFGYVSFGCYEEDLQGFADRLQSMGIQRLDPPKGVDSNGLWFRDHDNNLVEIKVAEKSSPNEKSVFSNPSSPANVRGAPFRADRKRTRPRRMSHMLLFTTSIPKAIEFYSRVLGMRLSDRSGDGIAFLHGIHGSDHHMIAFAHSSAPGHHHFSWDVGSVDEIGAGAMHMYEKGFKKGWGFGRHVLGSNFFHYIQDPWGSFCEYSADMDYVPVDQTWAAEDRPDDDSFYFWGPDCPDYFIHNAEAAAA